MRLVRSCQSGLCGHDPPPKKAAGVKGGGTHTGPAFSDFPMGSLPPASGRKMRFSGTTVLRIQNGRIIQEIGLDDGVKALTQLGLIKAA